jgi:hypothetical protein
VSKTFSDSTLFWLIRNRVKSNDLSGFKGLLRSWKMFHFGLENLFLRVFLILAIIFVRFFRLKWNADVLKHE